MLRSTALAAALALYVLAGQQPAHADIDANAEATVASILAGAPAPAQQTASAAAASPSVLTWLRAHWFPIAVILGAWAAIASVVNRKAWPKPVGPAWKVMLHAILIDGPAFLPSLDMRGMWGLPVNVPFFTLSNPAPMSADVAAANAEPRKGFDPPPPVQRGFVRPGGLITILCAGALLIACAALKQATKETEADCAPALEAQAPAIGTTLLASIVKQVQLGNAATSSEFEASLVPLAAELGPGAWCLIYNGARHLVDDLQQQQTASLVAAVAEPCKLHRPKPEHLAYLQHVIELALSKVPHKPPVK